MLSENRVGDRVGVKCSQLAQAAYEVNMGWTKERLAPGFTVKVIGT